MEREQEMWGWPTAEGQARSVKPSGIPSQPVVASRDPYLRVYFAQISPFDFWAEMEAMKEPERLLPKFRPKFREICLLAMRNFRKKFAY